jgi:hypothetical protein
MGVVLLVLVGALVYLPLIHKIGYTHDDWYLMASAGAEGPGVFRTIYSVDRPLRAYVLAPAFELFGQNVLFYNLSAWAFRVLSAILFLWLLRMLWPGWTVWTWLMAVLYLIYPGFLSQLNGIDYQSQILSLALAMLSVALTVTVYFQKNTVYKVMGVSLSILLGLLYLGLVEYEAGFELMRLAILFTLAGRAAKSFRDRIIATIKLWMPYSFVLLGFGIWRVFIFQAERRATDIGVQFERLILYPVQTMAGWFVQVVQDLFDITFAAWVIPFSQVTSAIQGWGVVLALVAAGLVLILLNMMKLDEVQQVPPGENFIGEALLIGFLTALGGLIPIALVNREVFFPSFSRYAVTGSFGVVMMVVVFLMRLSGRQLRNGLAAILVFISAATHLANSYKQSRETAELNDFWWQVSWRIPQLEKNTTLIAYYPVGAIEEDYFVWGPASLIYYPESQNPEVVQPGLFAAVLNQATVSKVLTRERQEYDNRRGIITYKNYRNMVVLSQPGTNSCLHVIDGNRPEFSTEEQDSIRVIGAFSEIEHVLVDDSPHTPPAIVFGSEPLRGWCYYYQIADLARQRGRWDEVIEIGEQAVKKGFAPNDLIEWMPFLQAYARAGDVDRLNKLAATIKSDPYVSMQVCRIIGSMREIPALVLELIDSQYCLE